MEHTVKLVRALTLMALAAACTGAAKGEVAAKSKPAVDAPAPRRNDFPVKVSSDPRDTVIAWFQGEKPPDDLGVPLVFGTTRLAFTFKGDKTALEFKPKGELHFSDWQFDIFSPDGKWVLLLQDRFGPYHVVAVSRLKDYLLGKAGPDKVVTVPRPPGQAALVHSGAKWVSPTEFEYQVGGEQQETQRASVAP